jgi:hypothetical protein
MPAKILDWILSTWSSIAATNISDTDLHGINLKQHSRNQKKILTQEALKKQEAQTVEQAKEMLATKRVKVR